MATDRRNHRAVTFLTRSGGLLALAAIVLGLMARIPAGSPASNTSNPIGIGSNERASVSPVVDGDIQVAVAEAYSVSPADWQRLLAGLSAELRLGLAIEVALPATTSNEGPPSDSLNRLLWAKSTLHRHRIELRVEQDAIRVVPLPAPAEFPAEA